MAHIFSADALAPVSYQATGEKSAASLTREEGGYDNVQDRSEGGYNLMDMSSPERKFP